MFIIERFSSDIKSKVRDLNDDFFMKIIILKISIYNCTYLSNREAMTFAYLQNRKKIETSEGF